jgi:hypothetical protein
MDGGAGQLEERGQWKLVLGRRGCQPSHAVAYVEENEQKAEINKN